MQPIKETEKPNTHTLKQKGNQVLPLKETGKPKTHSLKQKEPRKKPKDKT